MSAESDRVLQFVHSGFVYDSLGNKRNLADGVISIGKSYDSSAQFSRPADATQYSIDDVVGCNPAEGGLLEFKNIGKPGDKVIIIGATMEIWVNAVPNGMGVFQMHVYNAPPTPIQDNSPFTLLATDRRKHVGRITLPTPDLLGATAKSQAFGYLMDVTLVSTSIFVQLVTKAVYIPTPGATKYINMSFVGV